MIPSLLMAGKSMPDKFPANSCPFYDDLSEEALKLDSNFNKMQKEGIGTKRFRNHIAAHMEQLALFTLPRLYDDDSSMTDIDQRNEDASEVSSVQSSSDEKALSSDKHEEAEGMATAETAIEPVIDTDVYEDFKKLLLAEKADREAREKAAKQAKEDKLAALEAAKKRAEDIAKAAETAAADAKTEAEKKAAEEQKKLKEEAEEAAAKAKAKANLEAAAKKYEEEKEAAVARVPAEKQKPIKFKDALGRKFSFPFHLCKTWEVS